MNKQNKEQLIKLICELRTKEYLSGWGNAIHCSFGIDETSKASAIYDKIITLINS